MYVSSAGSGKSGYIYAQDSSEPPLLADAICTEISCNMAKILLHLKPYKNFQDDALYSEKPLNGYFCKQ